MKRRRRASAAATIKDVAKHLGVAVSSVSRALNNHPDVSEDMQERVFAAAKELGYEPDFVAQSLRRGATKTVGFILRDISNPLFADIVKGAEAVLHGVGYSTLLANSDQNPTFDLGYVRLFRQRRVDGLILSLQSENQPGLVEELSSLDFPIVLLDREVEGVKASSVVSDHFAGVERAVQHLLALGHRSTGFISGPEDVLATRERLRGYRSALESQGIPFDESLVRLGSYGQRFGYDAAIDLLSGDNGPTALVAGGLQLLVGVLAACRQLSLAVGPEVSIVGCDEVELMQFVDPPISVVRRDPSAMGRLAAELLIERLEEEVSPRKEIVPTEYIPRGSTMPVRR